MFIVPFKINYYCWPGPKISVSVSKLPLLSFDVEDSVFNEPFISFLNGFIKVQQGDEMTHEFTLTGGIRQGGDDRVHI